MMDGGESGGGGWGLASLSLLLSLSILSHFSHVDAARVQGVHELAGDGAGGGLEAGEGG